MLKAAEIRERYTQFFVKNGHTHVSSSPIVPPDDPTMMFCSAGMVQFKPLYSGAVALPYTRATTVQKCLRAGGKGSDLENVGVTLRHHTFFEMLGNFSFGDYFKEDAIKWAWEFCTGAEWLGLPAERIFPTVYGKKDKKGEWIVDDEAEAIWGETGNVNPVTRLDEKENFWGPAGESGACGPCSEIKFFMGSEEQLKEYRDAAFAGEAGMAKLARDVVEEGDLFLEIWNLVFPQFDQQLDGGRNPLKNRGIDTGMGLERTTTACQFMASGGAINTPYESDLLSPLIEAVSGIAGLPYPKVAGSEAEQAVLRKKGLDPAAVRLAMNACADHARALTFTLAEGIVPSNEGRGYVLRRILRRAARFGKKIGIADPFLWKLVSVVIGVMGKAYPEIAKTSDMIERIIRKEEERFNRTLNQGSEILDQMLRWTLEKGSGTLDGAEVYSLYETYGYPLDLTIEAAGEVGVKVDEAGYEKAASEAKAVARASWKGGAGAAHWDEKLRDLGVEKRTKFTGYETMTDEAKVLAILADNNRVDSAVEGQSIVIVLDETPFYAESGGQVGDKGVLTDEHGETIFTIEDTQKTADGYYLHFGETKAPIEVGQKLGASVDETLRRATMANHSVTHLMQGALKQLIGSHVTQQGSFVSPEGLRFDFTNPDPVDEATLRNAEAIVNEQIRRNMPVHVKEMPLEEARATGAIAPFGEKYGAVVRVVKMGDFSTEFCGGTHVGATGDIGAFVVTGESSVAAGIRRIEAKAGGAAIEQIEKERTILSTLARRMSAKPEALGERFDAMAQEIKALKREVESARSERARAGIGSAMEAGEKIGDVTAIFTEVPGSNMGALAEAWDLIKSKAEKTVGLLYSIEGGKLSMVAGVTGDIAGKRIKAGDVLNGVGAIVGGKGGGKPNMARGGGSQPEKIGEAKDRFKDIVEGLLK